MLKVAAELSAIEVKRLRHPGGVGNHVVAVGGVSGLLLQISEANGRSWILRTLVGGKRRHVGLGGYPDVTLAQARERAREAKDAIRRGIDPVAERKAARAVLRAARERLTFGGAVERFLAAKLDGLKNAKHRMQWRSTLDAYALPELGKLPVEEIDVHAVLHVLEPIWQEKRETASRLRGRIERVLAWATVAGHRKGENPALWRGNLDQLLPKQGKAAAVRHHPALSLAEAAPWFAALHKRSGTAARAAEFLTLTAARSGEVRGATWDEIDMDAATWIVPAARMKMAREHRVPLTPPVLVLLKALPRFPGNPLVFPAPRGGPLSDMTLSAVMRRMQETETSEGRKGWIDPRSGRPAVPHGLRSTFRDWAAERTTYPSEMAELALAHRVGSEVERAYRRGDMFERRREMMADWAGFLGAVE